MICEIEIDKEKTGLKFSIWALGKIFRVIEQSKSLDGGTYNEVACANIVYFGILNHSIVKQTPVKHSFEEIFNWVTDLKNVEQVEKAVQAFNEACTVYVKTLNVDGEKKRSTGKKLKKQRTVS